MNTDTTEDFFGSNGSNYRGVILPYRRLLQMHNLTECDPVAQALRAMHSQIDHFGVSCLQTGYLPDSIKRFSQITFHTSRPHNRTELYKNLVHQMVSRGYVSNSTLVVNITPYSHNVIDLCIETDRDLRIQRARAFWESLAHSF